MSWFMKTTHLLKTCFQNMTCFNLQKNLLTTPKQLKGQLSIF